MYKTGWAQVYQLAKPNVMCKRYPMWCTGPLLRLPSEPKFPQMCSSLMAGQSSVPPERETQHKFCLRSSMMSSCYEGERWQQQLYNSLGIWRCWWFAAATNAEWQSMLPPVSPIFPLFFATCIRDMAAASGSRKTLVVPLMLGDRQYCHPIAPNFSPIWSHHFLPQPP